MKMIYLIGSLRNPEIPVLGEVLRNAGFEVFDDWFSPGEQADEKWQAYETARGHTYRDALNGYAARHVFEFDKYHLDRADIVVLTLPAGKSGHLELGYSLGKGKPGYVLFHEIPERWDVMYQFATGVAFSQSELFTMLGDPR